MIIYGEPHTAFRESPSSESEDSEEVLLVSLWGEGGVVDDRDIDLNKGMEE